MNFTLDRAGLIFTLKILLGAGLAVFFISFFSNFAFSHIYPQSDQRLESAQEKLSRVQIDRFYRRQNLASAFDHLEKDGRITLAFVGDIMLDRKVKESILINGGGDFRYPFEKIYKSLREYDILFGNLEGPISDKGRDFGSLYSFRMDPKAVEGLAFAGFDILSLANNHIGDWGQEAEEDTLTRLERAGILSAGTDYLPKIIDINNTKIAFLAFYSAPETEIKKSVELAKLNADIIITSFHFGEEYQKEPNDYQKRLARLAVDAGANLVVGHHSHVIQEVELYNNSYIAYSLGNFVFDQDFSEDTMKGMLLEVVIKNKKITTVAPKRIRINSNFQPELIN